MTRKDYILIAAALLSARDARTPAGFDAWAATARSIADALQRDNARFDRARFPKAAGVVE